MTVVDRIAWFYAGLWTFGPFFIALRVIRRRSNEIVERIDRTWLKLGSVSVRVGGLRHSPQFQKNADYTAAVRSILIMVEVCRERLSEARVIRFWQPDRSVELIVQTEDVLKHVDIMIELCVARVPAVVRSAKASFIGDVSRRLTALENRINTLVSAGIPVGCERRLAIETRERLDRIRHSEDIDVSVIAEILGDDLRTIIEADNHLTVRERVWNAIDADETQVKALIQSVEATGILANRGQSDPSLVGMRWVTQTRSMIERVANDVAQVRALIALARTRCHPGKQKFSRPDGDLDRLLMAVQDSERALTLARQTWALALQASQALAASSPKAQA